jgi:hypothetical protein
MRGGWCRCRCGTGDVVLLMWAEDVAEEGAHTALLTRGEAAGDVGHPDGGVDVVVDHQAACDAQAALVGRAVVHPVARRSLGFTILEVPPS